MCDDDDENYSGDQVRILKKKKMSAVKFDAKEDDVSGGGIRWLPSGGVGMKMCMLMLMM